jgi:hypothetical protein
MKTRFILIQLLGLIGFVLHASAFYEPIVQRWINRDPINELGFRLQNNIRNNGTLDNSYYNFLSNSPIKEIDAFGLIKYVRATCTITEHLSDGNCMFECTCPKGYTRGFDRSTFPAPCDPPPEVYCSKPEAKDRFWKCIQFFVRYSPIM